MTSSASKDQGGFTVEFVRDPGVSGEWLNRFVVDLDTKKVLYYCDVSDDSYFEVHRGDINGPVVAFSQQCPSQPGSTDVVLTHPAEDFKVEHMHYDTATNLTEITGNGRKYSWKKGELVDEEGVLLAQLHVIEREDDNDQRLGTLAVKGRNVQGLTDAIVVSALLVQERSDENKTWF